jgi:hypothetical protein
VSRLEKGRKGTLKRRPLWAAVSFGLFIYST